MGRAIGGFGEQAIFAIKPLLDQINSSALIGLFRALNTPVLAGS